MTIAEYEAAAREALARAEKATPGPWQWEWDTSNEVGYKWIGHPGRLPVARASGGYSEDDASFIASARSDVPALARAVLDLAERLRAAEERILKARLLVAVGEAMGK